MDENFIELAFAGLTRGVSLQNAYIIIFKEKNGKRMLPLLADEREWKNMQQALAPQKNTAEKRLLVKMGLIPLYVRLLSLPGGAVTTAIRTVAGDQQMTVTAGLGEGVAWAFGWGCPIVVEESILNQRSGLQSAEGMVTMPISSMPSTLLREAMESAAARDDFELASALRDQLRILESGREDEMPEESKGEQSSPPKK